MGLSYKFYRRKTLNIEITIRCNGYPWKGGVILSVPEPLAIAFTPLKLDADPHTPVADAIIKKQKLVIREKAAKELSEVIVKRLLWEMQRFDSA